MSFCLGVMNEDMKRYLEVNRVMITQNRQSSSIRDFSSVQDCWTIP